MNKTELSVIIPAFDEAGRIGPTLERVANYLKGLGIGYEVVVVDDGSHDSTKEVVARESASMPELRLVENGINRGKGYSTKNGFLSSIGKFVLLSDADLSTPIEELPRFIDEMERGADIVIGSRALKGSDIIKRQPIYRVLMGKAFNKVVRVLTVNGISDTQCGFKLFRRDTCEVLFRAQRVERFAFDAELLFLAQKKGLRVVELPVKWVNSPLSKVNVVRDSTEMLADIIKIRLRYMSGGYAGFL